MTEDPYSVGAGVVPKWASGPLDAFMDDLRQSQDLLHVAMRGVTGLKTMPGIVDYFAKHYPEKHGGEAGAANRANAERIAAIAVREASSGFPLLHAQAAVFLWASLEVLIRDLVAASLQHKPELLLREPLSKVKIRVGEYESLAGDERSAYLVELLEHELQASLKPGIGRFECLLAAIGLDGSVPDATRRQLFELSQLRNLLVHRRGVADKRFVERCPWLSYAVGTTVTVSHDSLHRSHVAGTAYVMTVLERLGRWFGGVPDPWLVERIAEWDRDIVAGSERVDAEAK